MVLGRTNQPPQRQPMDLTCHLLDTIWQENAKMETIQAVERRPGQILEQHDLAEAQYMLTWGWHANDMTALVLESPVTKRK